MYDFHFTMNFHNEYLCSKFLIIHVIFSKALSTKCVLKCQTASLIIFVCGKMSFSIRLLVTLVATSVVTANYDPNCFGTRQAIVHLFEWRWDDIADECENFLAPKGYCGVQVSPPNEYRVVTSPMIVICEFKSFEKFFLEFINFTYCSCSWLSQPSLILTYRTARRYPNWHPPYLTSSKTYPCQ